MGKYVVKIVLKIRVLKLKIKGFIKQKLQNLTKNDFIKLRPFPRIPQQFNL